MQPNSLYLNHKQLVDTSWDYDKNTVDPIEVAQFSGKEVYWKCEQGHSYKMRVCRRTVQGATCPICKQQQLKSSSLYAKYKDLVDNEWRFDLNTLDPSEVSPHSGKRAWWTCKICGHTWECVIQNRTTDKSGCPECANRRKTSFPEQAIYFYIKQYFPDALNRYKQLGFELDIYIPSINTAIEYDGIFWHEVRKKQEIEKEQLCKKHNIQLWHIRENGLDSSHLVYPAIITNNNSIELTAAITCLMQHLAPNIQTDINIVRDTYKIYKQYNNRTVENSLESCYPQLALLFDIEKNNGLLPSEIEARSGKIVWWTCLKNSKHTWQALLHNMARKCTSGSTFGCPYCSGKHVLPEESFGAHYPDLALEWHPTKNSLKPTEVTQQSARKVWWICKNGHEWEERIYQRANRAHVCLFCNRLNNK